MNGIVWTIAPYTATQFATAVHEMAWPMSLGPKASGWLRLAQLAGEARWYLGRTDALCLAREAAHRSRALARVKSHQSTALSSWYRALALVMFAAARWHGGGT